MAEKSLTQKLVIRPGSTVVIVNRPREGASLLNEIGAAGGSAGVDRADVVLMFAKDGAELAGSWPSTVGAIRPEATLWIAYPKGSSGISTNLSRDRGWEAVIEAGFDAVSQISLDTTWSALRFRRDPALRAERAARGRPGPCHRPSG